MESSNLINKDRNIDGRHVMAGKERKSTVEGLAGRVRNIDGNVPQAILKKSAVVTKVGSINMPVKQTIESTGVEDAAESVQKVETTSYLEKVKHDIPLNNKDDRDPTDLTLRMKEADCIRRFEVASLDEESFLKQKAKVKWLAVGDANTKFFHMSLKCRNHRSRIDIIRDANGVLHEGGNVPIVFVKHFEAFLGVEGVTSAVLSPDLFSHQLATSSAMDMGPMKKGKAKVSWEAICVPRSEGGLGIRRIGDMNKALMTSHIWSIITNRESLWVAWVHAYRLRGNSFWDYCIPKYVCMAG
ncbi:hypothetical protein QVD17_30591 [Tagetes erecta]|uniref:RNA-directed DNA polymerase, eukaryota n=1 Tax=Tagetes erecta TaxID=13708 RepID=A0AAD8K251_TARER|nr:hypothetical protein QVD17_30591 [Tagetes erecta]